jgi:hypothetical protein
LPLDDLYLVEEVAAIDASLEYERVHVGAGFWKPFACLKDRKVLWRFVLGGMLFMFQNGSGINAIVSSPIVIDVMQQANSNCRTITRLLCSNPLASKAPTPVS